MFAKLTGTSLTRRPTPGTPGGAAESVPACRRNKNTAAHEPAQTTRVWVWQLLTVQMCAVRVWIEWAARDSNAIKEKACSHIILTMLTSATEKNFVNRHLVDLKQWYWSHTDPLDLLVPSEVIYFCYITTYWPNTSVIDWQNDDVINPMKTGYELNWNSQDFMYWQIYSRSRQTREVLSRRRRRSATVWPLSSAHGAESGD